MLEEYSNEYVNNMSDLNYYLRNGYLSIEVSDDCVRNMEKMVGYHENMDDLLKAYKERIM